MKRTLPPDWQQAEGPHFRGPLLEDFHLAILVPSGPSWATGFAISLLKCVQSMHQRPLAKRHSYRINNQQSSMLPYSREAGFLAAMAMDPEPTHVLMLDSDMEFPEDTIHWMVWRNESVLLANYVKRCVPTIPVTRDFDGRYVYTHSYDTGLQEVKFGGLGCCMITMDVLKALPRPWFNFNWRPDPHTPGNFLIDGEDTGFFNKCREAGYKVMLDHDLSKHVNHIGEMVYTNRMGEMTERENDEAIYGKSAA
ncbi:MAG: hypothetical protein MUE59_06200 [Thiobacillaceae bacterium]|jgi:hypothetical protein|nr:hypothetical protein [Thiobacillaceae bacterium]